MGLAEIFGLFALPLAIIALSFMISFLFKEKGE